MKAKQSKFGGKIKISTLSGENKRKPGGLANSLLGPSFMIGFVFVSRHCISSAKERTSHLLSVHVYVSVSLGTHMYMHVQL